MFDAKSWHLNYVKVATDLIIFIIFLPLVFSRANYVAGNGDEEPLEKLDSDEISAKVSNQTYKKYHHLYEHIDRARLDERCAKAKACLSSGEYWIVCGSDGQNYQNMGVLACAQLCNLELKFKGFGPCSNSVPIRAPKFTIPSVTTSTNEPQKRVLKQLISDTDIKEEDVLKDLKRRIQSRYRVTGMSPALEHWCKENPSECPYGYDPSMDPGVYLIPAIPYSELEVKYYKSKP